MPELLRGQGCCGCQLALSQAITRFEQGVMTQSASRTSLSPEDPILITAAVASQLWARHRSRR